MVRRDLVAFIHHRVFQLVFCAAWICAFSFLSVQAAPKKARMTKGHAPKRQAKPAASTTKTELPSGVKVLRLENGRITLNAQNAKLADLVKAICQKAGIELIGADNLEGTVTRKTANEPIDITLSRLLRGRTYVATRKIVALRILGPKSVSSVTGKTKSSGVQSGKSSFKPTPAPPKTVKTTTRRKTTSQEELDSILKDLKDRDPFVREGAVSALVDTEWNGATQKILEVLKTDRSAEVRRAAIEALSDLNAKTAIKDIAEALKNDKSSDVREAAALALGDIGDPAALPALVDALGDEESVVQDAAADSILYFDDEQIIPVLRKALKHKNPEVRKRAAEMLSDITGEKIKAE